MVEGDEISLETLELSELAEADDTEHTGSGEEDGSAHEEHCIEGGI